MLATVLMILVGLVFLLTGLIKVVYSRPFIMHVKSLGILPRSVTEIAASLFIQLECAIGTALVLSAFPRQLLPALVFLILGLSILTAWGVSSGRIEDCGCYGGWLNLRLHQSLALNALYALMLGVGWWLSEVQGRIPMWKVLAVIAVMAATNFLIRGSANAPLIDLSPLKPGRRWKPRWVDPSEFAGDRSDSLLFIFMSQRCYRCREWDPYILNLRKQPDLPFPVLIFPNNASAIEERLKHVPHRSIATGLFRYLVSQTPTAVLVERGIIQDRWVTRFPDAFI